MATGCAWEAGNYSTSWTSWTGASGCASTMRGSFRRRGTPKKKRRKRRKPRKGRRSAVFRRRHYIEHLPSQHRLQQVHLEELRSAGTDCGRLAGLMHPSVRLGDAQVNATAARESLAARVVCVLLQHLRKYAWAKAGCVVSSQLWHAFHHTAAV